ncbi:MAG: type II toxin-antitoxin system prevent-host-death family antitoxin [Nitrospirales bacterium]|nr:type II toxin-antitoxin system prevent-host-death family antitoxin [Nitrospirales bacterium]
MAIVTIQQANVHFAQLIQRALAGEEIIVAKGKKPVAKIIPIPAFKEERTLGGGKGIVKYISSDFDDSVEEFPDVES